MTDTLATLRAARALIADPARWCRGTEARDAQGFAVPGVSSVATCWCAIGAVRSAAGGYQWADAAYCLARALHPDAPNGFAAEHGIGEVESHNDDPETTHADVLAMFDTAIAALAAREG